IVEQLSHLGAGHTMVEFDLESDSTDHLDLRECKLGRDLVRRDPERVETARQASGFEHDDVVPKAAELVGAAQPGGAGADHSHAPACLRPWLEERDATRGRKIAGMPLKPADRDRRFQENLIHARAFAENFRGAGARTTAAENVGLENRSGGADLIVM